MLVKVCLAITGLLATTYLLRDSKDNKRVKGESNSKGCGRESGFEGVRLGILISVGLLMVFMGLVVADADNIQYSYDGNYTNKLYSGGKLFFPKSMADRVKVEAGGVIVNETSDYWVIKASGEVLSVRYISLSENSFSYDKQQFRPEKYPADLVEPVTKNQVRVSLKNLNTTLTEMKDELSSVENRVEAAAQKPTAGEQLTGFLLYYPPMWIIYLTLGVTAFLGVIGKRYGE